MADLQINPRLIPQGSLVLVIGANGFIASHIIDQLLGAGYKVRGTVRDKARTQWVNELFDGKYGAGYLHTVEVPDITLSGAFDEAVKGVNAIAHVASIMTLDPNPNNVIPPLITGTLGLLEAAAREPTVKRFVLTSSSHAVVFPRTGEKVTLEKDTFNSAAVKMAYAPPPYEKGRGMVVYAASKLLVEQAVRKWVGLNPGRLEVNYVLPATNFGPALHKDHPGSQPWRWPNALYKNHPERIFIPSQYYIDVRDTARLHMAALLMPTLTDSRIFGFAGVYTINRLLGVLRKLYPNKEFSQDIPDEAVNLMVAPPAAEAEDLLKSMGRKGWVELEDTVRENLKWEVQGLEQEHGQAELN
ncbi:hypothetical protein BJX70DRAFT_408387 [Aspergillus crustosus]